MASSIWKPAGSILLELPASVTSTNPVTISTATLTANLNRYQYKPIEDTIDSIRILVLHPATNVNTQIRCSLVHKTFRDKPSYDALSYTWGTDFPTNLIYIEGIQHFVRENLYHALCGLRQTERSRNLWIDAVCINQQDIEERARQVGLMDFIYIRASKVLVWLGAKIYYGEERCAQEFLKFQQEACSDFHVAICRLQYWRRLWIIQEIGLARSIDICINNDTKDWNEFVLLLSYHEPRIGDRKLDHFIEGRNLIKQLDAKRRGRNGGANRLEVLLEDFEYALCLERRDKIYGLLGLAHDCQDGTIQVDYSKAYYELYCDVIAFFTKQRPLTTGNDFDRSMRLVKFSQMLQRLLDTDYLKRETPGNPSALVTIQGALISVVKHIGPSYEDMISSSKSNKQWVSSFPDHESRPEDVVRRREANEAYLHILLAMSPRDVAKIHNVYPDDSQHMFWSRGIATAGEWQDNWESATLEGHASLTIADTPMLQAPGIKETNPRMFLGTHGHMGLSSGDTQVGDVICQFWETDVAVLLRREDHIYRVVGRVNLCRGSLEQLTPKYVSWNEIPNTANRVIMQMDIDVLSFLTC